MDETPAQSEPDRIYAIADIHGRSDLLDRMVREISRDLEAHPVETALTVTLGDYVDRGPDSRGVIERLMHNPFQTPLVALKGNHESLFETFLKDPAVGRGKTHLSIALGHAACLKPLTCDQEWTVLLRKI
jgi:serine/threonine protein phosphatase 1